MIAYFRSHAITFDIAMRYQLGFVGEPLNGDERFAGRIAIPYLTPSGVTSMKYRATSSDVKPKYLGVHGQRARLYNTQAYFSATGTLGVSEGELDAIAATEHLRIATLGVPGANNFDSLWLPLFKDFSQVLIFADGDDAGTTFATQLAELIGWRARIVQCPPDQDVSSMVAGGLIDELRQLATLDSE